MKLTADRGCSEPRFISARTSFPNTGNLVVEELMRADASMSDDRGVLSWPSSSSNDRQS